MIFTLILFLIGILGFVFNRKNIILMLISIEIMLLAITLLILVSSLNMDDILGQTIGIYIIVIAGAESAIGLAILVAFYRFKFYFFNSRSFCALSYSRELYSRHRLKPFSCRYLSAVSVCPNFNRLYSSTVTRPIVQSKLTSEKLNP
jgi:NADH-ubiquinone oxidoreductase chain 4L